MPKVRLYDTFLGGLHHALILINHATRYNWTFGLKTLSSVDIISALCLIRATTGSLARCFYLDCNLNLFGLAVSKYLINGQFKVVPAPDLINNQSKVIATLVKCQSANGLVELHWKVMVHMDRAYLTKKQMPCTFWFYLITHMARMMNATPGKHSGRLASPFLLVHSVGHDEQTWAPLFLLAYLHHKKDGNFKWFKHQAHTMDGIVIGRFPTSNALLVFNPCNKQYYKPDSYRLDPYCLPGSAYPSINTTVVCFAAFSVRITPSLKKITHLAPE
jgi:hypothetical protein